MVTNKNERFIQKIVQLFVFKFLKIETMKNRLSILAIGVHFLSNWIFCQSELSKTNNMTHEKHFPRIEFYSDRDYADHSNWTDKHINPDGTIYYMGARSYKPFVDRKTYLLDKEQTKKLLKSNLVFLPYFGEMKPTITFEHYFKTSVLQNLPQRTELFPPSLDKYLSYPNDDRLYFNTIIEYKNMHPSTVAVVWLDKDTWYVDNVFYRMEIDGILAEASPIEETQLVEGTLENFMNHSFVIQPKLSEGFSYLAGSNQHFKKDDVVLEIALTPGGPGSSSFSYTFYADGRIVLPGFTYASPSYFITNIQWVGIQNQLREINFNYLSSTTPAPQFVHDGQNRIFGARQDGHFYRLIFGNGSPMSERVITCMEYILNVISEIASEK